VIRGGATTIVARGVHERRAGERDAREGNEKTRRASPTARHGGASTRARARMRMMVDAREKMVFGERGESSDASTDGAVRYREI